MSALKENRIFAESARLALVFLASLWVTSPFFTRALIGGGDAVWYHHQVADAVTQFRAGIFPVFTGQTQYAFNGAIHPFRTAPYLQYFAGLIDLITGHRLEFHSLLHLTAQLSLVGGALSCYLGLAWIAPQRRWRAAVLAVVYVFAPGVLGLPFAQDLYMSTMAIPWVPLACASIVQLYQTRGYAAPLVLGFSLGALFWAHSPIAVWTTLAVTAASLAGLVGAGRQTSELAALVKRSAVVALPFLALAAYPIVSVLSLRSSGERIVPRLMDRQSLYAEISNAFPHLLLPVKVDGALLNFMQPGYVALAALVCALGLLLALRRTAARWPLGALVSCALIFLVLILPVPLLTQAIWSRVPETIANMTSIWPMQRLSVVIVAISLVAFHAALAAAEVAHVILVIRLAKKFGTAAGVGAVIWTVFQAAQVRTLGVNRTRPLAETQQMDLSENVNLSEYAYQQLPQRPAYFIHGVEDPAMDLRLLDRSSGEVLLTNKSAAERGANAAWFDLKPTKTENPALFLVGPSFSLNPGTKYLLTFEFFSEDISGLLHLKGPQMHRFYILPSAGDAKGFGAKAGQEKSLVLWTNTLESAERVQLEYIQQGAATPWLGASLGRARLSEVDQAKLPVEVTSLMPLAATVRAPVAATLETMRVFIPGWTATLDGKTVEVRRSAEGLAAVEVPRGESQLTLIYRGSSSLRFAFWLSLSAWLIFAVSGVVLAVTRFAWPRKILRPEPEGRAS